MMYPDISKWKVRYGDVAMAQVLSCVKSLDQTKVVTKALDGTVYYQTIGHPVNRLSVSIFSTREEMHVLNELIAAGADGTITYREKTYSGFFEEALEWSPAEPGEYYVANGSFIIDSEVNAE